MKLWSFKPTEFLGVGCRVAAGLAVCTYVGYFLFLDHQELDEHFKSLLRTFFKWAAVTVVVTTQPLTGRVAEICIQRMIGTVAGGFFGFVVATFASRLNILEDEIFMTFLGAFVGFLGCYLGWLLKLETSARLFTMTYLLVAYGVDKSSAAEEVAITRTGGICTGVLVSMTMAVIIFPNSATDEVVEKMRKAVGQLGKLNELAWAHAELAQNPSLMQIMGRGTAISSSVANQVRAAIRSEKERIGEMDELKEPLLGDNTMSDSKLEEGRTTREVDLLQKAAEGVLAGIYKDLDGSEGLLLAAKQEILIPIWSGRWCFLPGNAFCLCPGQWVLPTLELQEVSTTLRRVARLIWTLHTTFVEGFDENMAAVLEKQYPKPLFPLLIKYSTDFVNDVVASFPYKKDVPEANLVSFEKCVEALHCVSDYQRRRIIRALKYYKRKASLRRSTTLAGRSRLEGELWEGMRPSYSSRSLLLEQCNSGGLVDSAQSLASQCLPGAAHAAPQTINLRSPGKIKVESASPMASPPAQTMGWDNGTPGSSPTAILLRLRDMTAIDIQPPTPTHSEFTETPRSLLQYSYGHGTWPKSHRASLEFSGAADGQQANLFRRSMSVGSDLDAHTPPHFSMHNLERSSMQNPEDFDEVFAPDAESRNRGLAGVGDNSGKSVQSGRHPVVPGAQSAGVQYVGGVPAGIAAANSAAGALQAGIQALQGHPVDSASTTAQPSTTAQHSTTVQHGTSAQTGVPAPATATNTHNLIQAPSTAPCTTSSPFAPKVQVTPTTPSPNSPPDARAVSPTQHGRPVTPPRTTFLPSPSFTHTPDSHPNASPSPVSPTYNTYANLPPLPPPPTASRRSLSPDASASLNPVRTPVTSPTTEVNVFLRRSPPHPSLQAESAAAATAALHLNTAVSNSSKSAATSYSSTAAAVNQAAVTPAAVNQAVVNQVVDDLTYQASKQVMTNTMTQAIKQVMDEASNRSMDGNATGADSSASMQSGGTVLAEPRCHVRHHDGTLGAEHPPGDLPPIPEDKSYADLTVLDRFKKHKNTATAGTAEGTSSNASTVEGNYSMPVMPESSSSLTGTTSDETLKPAEAFDTTELRWKLPRASTLEMSLNVMFPDTEEGYIAKVRWYSFQFLMEELADEFRNLHSAMLQLIPKLPHHKKKRRKQAV